MFGLSHNETLWSRYEPKAPYHIDFDQDKAVYEKHAFNDVRAVGFYIAKNKWEPKTWPKNAEGVGMTEAPRGALAHWIKIKDKVIDNYQMVVHSTWNASPRDPSGKRSAYEEALIGTPVHDPDQPLEILRTIHSFDPCIACAVHLYDPEGKHIHDVHFQ